MRHKSLILAFLIFSLCFTGCSVSSSNKKRSRGSLKQATEKASDKHDGDRTVQTTYEKSDDEDDNFSFFGNSDKKSKSLKKPDWFCKLFKIGKYKEFKYEYTNKYKTENSKQQIVTIDPKKINNPEYMSLFSDSTKSEQQSELLMHENTLENKQLTLNKPQNKSKKKAFKNSLNLDKEDKSSIDKPTLSNQNSSLANYNRYAPRKTYFPPKTLDNPFAPHTSNIQQNVVKTEKTDIADTNKVVYNKDEGDVYYFNDARSNLFFRINALTGSLKSNDFYGLVQFGIGVGGFLTDNLAINVDWNFGYSNVQQTSELSHSLKNGIGLVNFNLSLNKHLSGSHTFMSPYLGGGIGVAIMGWDYKNPIEAVDGDEIETISHDNVWGLDFFVCAGTKTFQGYPFNLTLQSNIGAKCWADRTLKDFENDLFDTMPYINFELHLEFRMRKKED